MEKSILKLGVIICYSFMALHLIIACLILYVGEPAGEALEATFQFFVMGVLMSIFIEVKHFNKESLIYLTQDPKYVIIDNKLCNSATHKPILENMPIFIFLAKDTHAAEAIKFYAGKCCDPDHRDIVAGRWHDFNFYARENKKQMKEPDTQA